LFAIGIILYQRSLQRPSSISEFEAMVDEPVIELRTIRLNLSIDLQISHENMCTSQG